MAANTTIGVRASQYLSAVRTHTNQSNVVNAIVNETQRGRLKLVSMWGK